MPDQGSIKMQRILSITLIVLVLAATANAQITRHYKYDWGWSYLLEMPETGLSCEFPNRPSIVERDDGWLVASTHWDDFHIAARINAISGTDVIQRMTLAFVDSFCRGTGLSIDTLMWLNEGVINGYRSSGAFLKTDLTDFHIDASLVNGHLTLFMYSHKGAVSIPTYFFSTGYSLYHLKRGPIAKDRSVNVKNTAPVILTQHSHSFTLTLGNSGLSCDWPKIPNIVTGRHSVSFSLDHDGAIYSIRIIKVKAPLSYGLFNSFINREHQVENDLYDRYGWKHELLKDESHAPKLKDRNREPFFRTLDHNTKFGSKRSRFIAFNNFIIIQQLKSRSRDETFFISLKESIEQFNE